VTTVKVCQSYYATGMRYYVSHRKTYLQQKPIRTFFWCQEYQVKTNEKLCETIFLQQRFKLWSYGL